MGRHVINKRKSQENEHPSSKAEKFYKHSEKYLHFGFMFMHGNKAKPFPKCVMSEATF